MAIYAPIHKTLWSDPDFCKLEVFEKYLFVYLISAPTLLPSGMFDILPKKITFDTGIPEEKAREILLSGKLKNISYDEKTGYIFVHNKLKFSPGGRKELVRISVNTQYKRTPTNPLWDIFNNLYPNYLIGFSTVVQQLSNSYPTDEKVLENKDISTVVQQMTNSYSSVDRQMAISYATDAQQMPNSCPTDSQQFLTSTSTMSSVEQKNNHPLPLPTRKGDRKKLLGNKGEKFKEIFARFPGKKEAATFCKTRFMDQMKSDDDLAAMETALDKYITAHKSRKVSDMARIRFMKSNVFFDKGWLIVADPDWMLGKPPELKIIRSQDAIQEEKLFWVGEAMKALEEKDLKRLESARDYILEFQDENPEMEKVLPTDLQIKIENFLTQQEA